MSLSSFPPSGTIYQYAPAAGKPKWKEFSPRIHFIINIVLLVLVVTLLNNVQLSDAQTVEATQHVAPNPTPTSSPSPEPTVPDATPNPTEAPLSSPQGASPITISSPASFAQEARFIWPTRGSITSTFTAGHNGIDITRVQDTSIRAAAGGTIIFSGCGDNGYGCYIIIDHGDGYKTLYAHLSVMFKQAGEHVPQGDGIGIVGDSGNATAIHLHFAVLRQDTHIDPFTVLPP